MIHHKANKCHFRAENNVEPIFESTTVIQKTANKVSSPLNKSFLTFMPDVMEFEI